MNRLRASVPPICVIVTTYNRPDALAAALAGYLAQDDKNFELIVADDGSTAETRAVIDAHRSLAPYPVLHVWQEDRGFRAAAIRNRALAASSAEYMLFTDGDCVPTRNFVARHRALAEPGWLLAGNRLLLSPAFTRRVLAERLPVHTWSYSQWAGAWLKRDINRWLPLLNLPDSAWRKHSPQRWEGVKTCNLAVSRDAMLRVNGLDERYTGWGLEDSDLVIRLLRSGVRHKSARYAAPLLHLWHAEFDRHQLAANRHLLDCVLASTEIEAAQGLCQYL